MKFLLGLFVFLSVSFTVSISTTEAATLYIDPGIATLYRGDAITTSVRIMPDQASGECINTIDAIVTYPENIQPVDISIGRSIFSVWVESPTINRENRTITFAGGIPNGYCGRVQGDPGLTNIIVDIVFRSPGLQIGTVSNDSTVLIDFAPETSVYLNDGKGTKADLRTLPTTLTLERSAGPGIVDDWRESVISDDLPPEEFSVTLERDSVAFASKYFIVFNTGDKQTGISHYEVMEEPTSEFSRFNWGGTDVPWIRTESPYVLKDQSLSSTIRVKAFDKAGNEYVATLVPDESLQTLSDADIIFYGAIAFSSLFIIIVLLITFVFIRRRRTKAVESSPNELES